MILDFSAQAKGNGTLKANTDLNINFNRYLFRPDIRLDSEVNEIQANFIYLFHI